MSHKDLVLLTTRVTVKSQTSSAHARSSAAAAMLVWVEPATRIAAQTRSSPPGRDATAAPKSARTTTTIAAETAACAASVHARAGGNTGRPLRRSSFAASPFEGEP